MRGPTEKTIRRLFALSGNVCAFPGCSLPIVEDGGIVTGEICHIRAQNVGGPRFDETQSESDRHAFDNLILLCRRHHKVVDAEPDLYSVDALQEIKSIREARFGRPERDTDAFYVKILLNAGQRLKVNNNSGNVVVDSPGAIVGYTIHVKTSRRNVEIAAPAGTIGADQDASRYVQHLISRYNEFASKEPSRARKFSYGAISKNIEHEFGAQWKLLSTQELDSLCTYLQGRIMKTRQAKLNAAKGWRSFSVFDDYTKNRGR